MPWGLDGIAVVCRLCKFVYILLNWVSKPHTIFLMEDNSLNIYVRGITIEYVNSLTVYFQPKYEMTSPTGGYCGRKNPSLAYPSQQKLTYAHNVSWMWDIWWLLVGLQRLIVFHMSGTSTQRNWEAKSFEPGLYCIFIETNKYHLTLSFDRDR